MNNKNGHEPTPQNPRRRVWLTINDILTELGIGRSTFDRWRSKGAGPQMKRLPNGTYRIRGDWFDEWLDQQPGSDGPVAA